MLRFRDRHADSVLVLSPTAEKRNVILHRQVILYLYPKPQAANEGCLKP